MSGVVFIKVRKWFACFKVGRVYFLQKCIQILGPYVHYWKNLLNFPSVCWLVCRSVDLSVYDYFLKGRKVTLPYWYRSTCFVPRIGKYTYFPLHVYHTFSSSRFIRVLCVWQAKVRTGGVLHRHQDIQGLYCLLYFSILYYTLHWYTAFYCTVFDKSKDSKGSSQTSWRLRFVLFTVLYCPELYCTVLYCIKL